MAFGQSAGPPATGRQVQELLELLNNAGHTDFRDARGPMGFTQRQAGGKFTRDEAQAFIDDLLEAEHTSGGVPAPVRQSSPPGHRLTQADRALRALSDEVLAAELQRRGWIVVEP